MEIYKKIETQEKLLEQQKGMCIRKKVRMKVNNIQRKFARSLIVSCQSYMCFTCVLLSNNCRFHLFLKRSLSHEMFLVPSVFHFQSLLEETKMLLGSISIGTYRMPSP